jgi:hypothetical protein
MIDKKDNKDNTPEEVSVGQTIELKEEKKGICTSFEYLSDIG